MTWFYYLLPAIVLFASLQIFQRKIGIDTANPRASAVVFNGIASLLALLIFFIVGDYQRLNIPTTPTPWILLGLGGLFYGLFERYRFSASKHLEASILVVINNWSFVVGFIGVILLYREPITINHLLGAGLILLSIMLVSMPKSKKVAITTIGLLFGFLTSTMIGLAQIFDKAGAENFSPALYSIIVWLAPIPFVIFPRLKLSQIKQEIRQSGKSIFIMSLINVIGYYLALKALEVGTAVQVVPMIQTYSIITVIFAAIFLKEREHLLLKFFAAILALIGIQLVL
jgi:uncharacterized membrane protein